MEALNLIIDNFTNFTTTSYNKSLGLFLDENNPDIYNYVSTTIIIGFLSSIVYSSMKYIYNNKKYNNSDTTLDTTLDSNVLEDKNMENMYTNIGKNVDNNVDNNVLIQQYEYVKNNNKRKIIKEGLFYESITELNDEGSKIVDAMEKDTFYWILLRVQTGNYIDMAGTHFELHGNHIIEGGINDDAITNIDSQIDSNIECNTQQPFKTRDFYMILKITTKTRINFKNDVLFGNAILKIMNYTNTFISPKFHNTDFIVCAIATSPYIDNDEFSKTLKGIEYDNSNVIVVPSMYGSVQGILLLPVHQVYDAFMDMYNNTIFESKKYVIDDDNYESWNGKSINEYKF